MKSLAVFLRSLEPTAEARTTVAYMAALAKNGVQVHAYLGASNDDRDLRGELRRVFGADAIALHRGWRLVAHHDLVLATCADSARWLANIVGKPKTAYWIQDFEPSWYPMGGQYLLTEHSFRQGMPVIARGSWLSHEVRKRFGATVHGVPIGVDAAVFKPTCPDTPREWAIAVSYTSANQRSAPVITLEMLKSLRRTLPDVKVYTFGAETGPVGLGVEHLGVLSATNRNDLFNRCAVGFHLSLGNPPRLPFEMLAAGLPVVEAERDNTAHDFSDRVVVRAPVDGPRLAEAVVDLLADTARRTAMGREAAAFMRSRTLPQEYLGFVQAMQRIIARNPAVESDEASLRNCPAVEPPATLSPVDLLTVDVWDTLLRRRCHPDEIKLFTARHVLHTCYAELQPRFRDAFALVAERVRCEQSIGREVASRGTDDEYGIQEVFENWLNAVVQHPIPAGDLRERAMQLVELEITQERAVIYRDPTVAAKLRKIAAARTLFLSDFYMPAKTIRELLDHAGAGDLVSGGFSSCDVGLNKRSGRLFQRVEQELGVSPARHFHIGDNRYSDVFVPKKLGISAIPFAPAVEVAKMARFTEEFERRKQQSEFVPPEIAALARRTRQTSAMSGAAALRNEGQAKSALFAGFALFIAEEALKAGLKQVYFFTREGEFFANVYRELARSDPFGTPFPEPIILEVSRLSTFAASLHRFDAAELMRLWNLYSTQSLAAFFTSLDADPQPVLPVLRQYGVVLTEPIKHPWADTRIQQLLVDPHFTRFLSAHCAQKRALLLEYLREKGITTDQPRIGIVDIGWRGTIQDNLAHVLAGTIVHGWYLGLMPFLNVQPPNVKKRAFGPGRAEDVEDVRRLLGFVSPIEMLCNSSAGTTLRYERSGDSVRAIRKTDADEEKVHAAYSRHFQAGVLASIPDIGRAVRERAVSSEELRPFVVRVLADLVHTPAAVLPEAYFSLKHNETFGVGGFVDKRQHHAKLRAIRQLFFTGSLEAFEEELIETTWPQGFAILCGVRYPYLAGPKAEAPWIPVEDRRRARELCREGIQSYKDGNFIVARERAIESIAVNPWRLKAHYLAYRSSLRLNQTTAAFQHFRLITRLCPTHEPSLNEFACGTYRVGRVENAHKLLERLVEENPQYLPGVLNLARVLLVLDRPVDALTLLEKCREHFAFDVEFNSFDRMARRVAAYRIAEQTEASDTVGSRSPLESNVATLWPAIPQDPQSAPKRIEAFGELSRLLSDDEYLSAGTSAPPESVKFRSETGKITKPDLDFTAAIGAS